jgi:hypothetical protein
VRGPSDEPQSGCHHPLVVDASPFATSPACGVGFVRLNLLSEFGTNPVLIRSRHICAELMQNAESAFIETQSKLPSKLHRRHAVCLGVNDIGNPEPYTQGSVAALGSCLATRRHDAGPRGKAKRLVENVTAEPEESIVPSGFFQGGNMGVIRLSLSDGPNDERGVRG